MPGRLASLPAIEAAIWRELAAAVADRQHAWRTAVLATTDGDSADARTVVLREVLADERRLRVYTDQRAPKVAQLQAHPLGTLVMWSAALGWQLRCRVRLQLLPQGLQTSSRWAGILHTPAEHDYIAPLAPGTELGAQPAADGVQRAHFAVIDAEVLGLDWLELQRDGRRRMRVDAAGARWVQP